MTEIDTERFPDIPIVISFDRYQSLTAPKAQYENAADPALVLRSGLIEETAEIIDTDPADREEMHKEIGDVLWYLSEVSRFHGLTLKEVASSEGKQYQSFDEYQDAHTPSTLHIYDSDGNEFNPGNDNDALAIRVLRIIDKLNPKTSELWEGYDEIPGLSIILHDTLACLSHIASEQGIRLNEAATRTLKKIYTRPRNPHVIDEANNMKHSQRGRLKRDPWVTKLFMNT